jgi:hypothetical protein
MEPDKKKHVVAGAVISIVGGAIFLPFAALGFLAGFVKEWIDGMGYGQVETADIQYTAVGALIGTLVIAFYRFSQIRRK